MKTIIVLGDCQSNGNNCLAHQIIETPRLHTWSLKFHNEFRNVFRWYLKHRIDNRVKDCIPNKNLEGAVWHYFWEEELKTSWPYLLAVPNVVNFSKNGAHFIGHLKRLKDYLSANSKPDHIIVTDYTFSHISTSFKFQGKRYCFERENYIDQEWNPEDYPLEVHQKRLGSIAYQKAQPYTRRQRKHMLGYNQLIRYIESHKIPFTTVRFGDVQENNRRAFDFIHQGVDCTDLYLNYATENGEDSATKLQLQSAIAERVANKLSIDFRSLP